MSPVDAYLKSVLQTFSTAADRALPLGTSVVGFDDRTSSTAVAYALPGRTLLACSPQLVERLGPLEGAPTLTLADLIDRCGALGGRRAGDGVNLLLPDGVPSPSDEPGANGRGDGLSVRWLDSSDPDDLALVRAFVESCPAEDVDEADIFVDQPDPVICVFVDDRDTIAAYASGRAFWAAAGFDDIGVLVRPDHRGVGLGAAVVHEFAAARCGTASQLYRHDVENVGSAGVARAVGFVELHRVHAFDFAD